MVQTDRTTRMSRKKGEVTFRMKRFAIRQELSALKVGTDGVLLGAYVGAKYTDACSVLDVGTGTGVIALMIAQSLPQAMIHAIDVDAASCTEAGYNTDSSPFAGRITVVHDDFSHYASTSLSRFDLIVSNPPYYTPTHESEDDRTTTAKHIGSLTPHALFCGAEMLLTQSGRIAIITATSSLLAFMTTAEQRGFYPQEVVYVHTVLHRTPKRAIIIYGKSFTTTPCCCISHLTIQEGAGRHEYTEEYVALLRPFLTIFP